MQLAFNKISNRWYVDLPDWEGDFDDLEMVAGADDMLDVLSQGVRECVTLNIWTSKPDEPCIHIHKIEETLDGATYQVNNCLWYKGTAWLCNVTKFVFAGRHPHDLYFTVENLSGYLMPTKEELMKMEEEVIEIPGEIELKKIKVSAVSLELKKAVDVVADMKQIVKCKTESEVKKVIEEKILETKVFKQSDLAKLKYQGLKDVTDEWKHLRKLQTEELQGEDSTEEPEEEVHMTKYDLNRFLSAQESTYTIALEEMQRGRKVGHWIWFIFPQNKGLGHSYNSQYYGLDGLEEAKAYLQHPVLSKRLREICAVLLEHRGKSIQHIMGGSLDAMKLHSSMEIFDLASPNDIFAKVIRTFF